MLQDTEHRYIATDPEILGGEPIVKGHGRRSVPLLRTGGEASRPRAIPGLLPHVTLAQVFNALSYYSDHTDEINALNRAKPHCR